MKDPVENGEWKDAATCDGAGAAETTLRLIARLPAPDGLEDRVCARLATAPRRGRILAWPAALSLNSGWMRSAAAAAIVFVVAGGGWGVYSRVQRPQPARVIVQAPRAPAQGGFASSGAMRTPQTLNGPVVAHPAAQPVQGKLPAKTSQKQVRRARPTAADKADSQAAAAPAK
jgi:hypothetical protein